MTITWKPTLGSGAYWKNGKCYGSGAIFNSTAHTIAKGTFDKSELNGNSCILVNYDDTVNVSIRFGQFVDNKENNDIIEYVFDKANWVTFQSTGTMSTKYHHLFSNGVYQSTTSTDNNIHITAITTLGSNNNINSFTFSEV